MNNKKLPSSHLLPSSAFRHIGVMVAFMGVIACICIGGFIGVNTITKSWITDIEHVMNIEIPPFNPATDDIFTANEIESLIAKIEKELKGDPIITSVTVDQAETQSYSGGDDRFDIQGTVFIAIALNANRNGMAETRLIETLSNIHPAISVITPDAMTLQIRQTAVTLKFIFCGLTLAVFAVTGFILVIVVQTQLKANQDTIHLIHLMGAETSVIARLFKNAVTKAVLAGVAVALGIGIMILFPIAPILRLDISAIHITLYGLMIGLSFIILCRAVTHISVMISLRSLP